MQRPIKFRSWNTENKYMTYGVDLVYDRGGKLCGLRHDDFAGDGEVNPNWNGDADIEEFEIMQYTGLKDKNGKEIYEGDIANITLGLVGKGGYTERGVMKWDENHAQFAFECNDSLFEDAFGNPVNFKIEVIGNIYENPELLKGVDG